MAGGESDDQLMARVRGGDHDAMRGLFERFRQPLLAFFSSRVGAVDVAEDLVQGVFVRVWTYRRSFEQGRAVRPWIFRIARNLLAEGSMARSMHAIPDHVAAPGPTPAEALDNAEKRTRVREALARLPESQRDALLLSRWSDMGYRDIGRVLGCSEGAVKLRVFRAMETLRQQLDPDLGGT